VSNILFLGTVSDRQFLPYLKPFVGDNKVFVDTKPIQTLFEIESYAKHPTRNITGVLSTSTTLLSKLTGKSSPSLDTYAGSYFTRGGIEYVFLNPLEHVVTVPYGKFLLERFTSKLCNPSRWFKTPQFNWSILTAASYTREYERFSSEVCVAIAVDIETFKQNLAIRCIGFTGIFKFVGEGHAEFQTRSLVLPLVGDYEYGIAKQFLNLPAPKIFQNGKYDCAYLARYDLAPYNYLWDTANLFHSWYSELPKDLAFLQSFFVREAAYWKDLANTNDLEQYYLYNAKDTWATACSFLSWMLEAPDWAHQNYLLEFPLTFPCHLSELTGLTRNQDRLLEARKEIEGMITAKSSLLDSYLGVTGFNVNSSPQMKKLMHLLGCSDLGGAGEKELAKAIYRHPLNSKILGVIRGVPKSDDPEKMGIRALRKLKSTYLRTSEDADKNDEGGAKELNGRILYALNPHGTDTSRLASREHHFWCGLQIQNIPVGKLVKQTIEADDGFYIGECDLEQAETRDTAYITGDKNLIAAISSDRDFHSHNVEAFFGLAYNTIYDDATHTVLNKPIRNIGKRVNHGANYMMGAKVLVDTMGEEAVYNAAKILKLPSSWTAIEIADHLLRCFEKVYPTVRGAYPEWVIEQILTNKKLVGALGWTRYCFNNPKKDKRALNAYVAHGAQSLNAQVLNKAYMAVFYDIAMNPEYSEHFKLCAQIHDSILFQYREGHEYLPEMVKERMEIPVRIKDIRGIERVFTVPAALKLGKVDKNGTLIRARFWAETE